MSTYMAVKEAAGILNISEQRVRTLCRSGVLLAKKFGRSWMLEPESVNKYGLQNITYDC